MLTMTTYANPSDNRVVSKDITTLSSYSIVLKDDCSERTPIVILSERPSGNYARIEEFGRYYYVVDKTFANGLWEVSLQCDVLMTFGSGIRNLTGIIGRQENVSNAYLEDNALELQNDGFTLFKRFGNGSSTVFAQLANPYFLICQ